jgi:hypothetical protein
MTDEQPTRFSGQLPNLLASLHLLYAGRLLAGFVATAQHLRPGPDLSVVDATIEAVTDEIRTTELLHEAALLVGDVLPADPHTAPADGQASPGSPSTTDTDS